MKEKDERNLRSLASKAVWKSVICLADWQFKFPVSRRQMDAPALTAATMEAARVAALAVAATAVEEPIVERTSRRRRKW